MEPLNIPHLADETLIGGSFQTPILEDVTNGQRDNSRLFHTREDDSLPFHYYPRNIRKKKILVNCSNHEFSGCKAKFTLISKNPENTMKVERPGKKAFFKINHNLPADVENWAVEPNSGNFQHSAYCRNQCPIEDRIYDFDIMNSRNSVEIRKEKKRKYTHFSEETAFQKAFRHVHTRRGMHSNKCEIDSQASAWGALDIIDNLIERDHEQKSALYHQRKLLIDGIPTACLEIIQGVRLENPILLNFWRVLTGSLFLNLNCPEILSEILRFFRFEILTDETLENSLKIQLKKYIDVYKTKSNERQTSKNCPPPRKTRRNLRDLQKSFSR